MPLELPQLPYCKEPAQLSLSQLATSRRPAMGHSADTLSVSYAEWLAHLLCIRLPPCQCYIVNSQLVVWLALTVLDSCCALQCVTHHATVATCVLLCCVLYEGANSHRLSTYTAIRLAQLHGAKGKASPVTYA